MSISDAMDKFISRIAVENRLAKDPKYRTDNMDVYRIVRHQII